MLSGDAHSEKLFREGVMKRGAHKKRKQKTRFYACEKEFSAGSLISSRGPNSFWLRKNKTGEDWLNREYLPENMPSIILSMIDVYSSTLSKNSKQYALELFLDNEIRYMTVVFEYSLNAENRLYTSHLTVW